MTTISLLITKLFYRIHSQFNIEKDRYTFFSFQFYILQINFTQCLLCSDYTLHSLYGHVSLTSGHCQGLIRCAVAYGAATAG